MFLHPLGLLALLAVPAVIGLHLFRRRFRPQVVSAVFLWEAVDKAAIAGRKREPLHRSASFWCELLAVLLIALAFAGPRACGAGEAQHLVIVLDGSASMNARGAQNSALDRACILIEQRIEALPRGSRATLIASGTRPRVLAGPAAFGRELLSQLESFEANAGRHDLEPAIAMGAQLAAEGGLLLITDQFEPDRWPAEVELVAVGEAAANIAIATASRRERTDGEAGEEVRVTLQNFGASPRSLEVRMLVAGEASAAAEASQLLLARRTVEIDAEERKLLSFFLPVDCPSVLIQLQSLAEASLDALAIDDRVFLTTRPPRTLALYSLLSREDSLHLGLCTGSPGDEDSSNIDRLLELVPHSIEAGTPSGAHLLIASEPAGTTPSWCFSIEDSEPDAERSHLIGPFLTDRRHPLMEGLTLDGIVWSTGGSSLPGVPIISAGNRPLMSEEGSAGRRLIRLHYDLRTSSLHRSPDWPILLTNLAELRRSELPGPNRTSLALGSSFIYRDRRPATYKLSGPAHAPQQARTLEARGTLFIDDLAQAGVWRLSRIPEDESQPTEFLCEIATSFIDAAESDLRQLSEGTRETSATGATVTDEFTWMEILLIASALALILLDFFVLHGSSSRRVKTSGASLSHSGSAREVV